jgi:hypothetical protein
MKYIVVDIEGIYLRNGRRIDNKMCIQTHIQTQLNKRTCEKNSYDSRGRYSLSPKSS